MTDRHLRLVPTMRDRLDAGDRCIAELNELFARQRAVYAEMYPPSAALPDDSSGVDPEAREAEQANPGSARQGAETRAQLDDDPDPYFTDIDREDDGIEDGWRGL